MVFHAFARQNYESLWSRDKLQEFIDTFPFSLFKEVGPLTILITFKTFCV